MIKHSGLTPEQRGITLERFKATHRTKEMYLVVKDYLAEFGDILAGDSYSKGLALTGTVGVGKTMLAMVVANELLARQIPVIFISTPDLMAELLAAQFSDDKTELEQKIRRLSEVQVVIWDDLAKEKATDWVRTQYYRIVDARYRNKLPTLYTSNLTQDQIADRLGEAVASRLYALTRDRQVIVEAEDYRITG